MIVEGTMIAPAVENEMEAWMLANRFSAMRAQFHAEALLNGAGQNPRLGHRLADRLIQRLRKAGKIRFERENGGVVWRAAQ